MELLSLLAAALRRARILASLGRRAFRLDAAGWRLMQAAKHASTAGPGLFPEQRLRFLFDGAGRVLLVRRGAPDGGGGGSGAEGGIRGRAPLPEWLGAGLPAVDEAGAAAMLEESIFFEPFGREDAGRLLAQGCEVQVRVWVRGTATAARDVQEGRQKPQLATVISSSNELSSEREAWAPMQCNHACNQWQCNV
jgi:hypothetical protein